MKKRIIVSVNDNPDYLYYTPLCAWAWRKFGWEIHLMYLGKEDKLFYLATKDIPVTIIKKQEGYRDDTVTQISRLYAACCYTDDSFLMTSDIDMIPLSDYWYPKKDEITVYGHDLTSYTHYPICYIGMEADKWKEVMQLDGIHINSLIKRDLDSLPQAKDSDFYKYWFSDQDKITQALNEYGKEKLTIINRGQYENGYAKGRVDRGAWNIELDQYIDSHLLRDIYKNDDNFLRTMELLETIFPNETFSWLKEYTNNFSELIKQTYG